MSRSAQSYIVGYRSEDQQRYFKDATIKAGRCDDCGAEVFLNSSGVSAMRERDSILYCMNCSARNEEDHKRGLAL